MQNQQRQPEWTILKLIRWATPYFKSRNIDSPRATAEILLAHTLKSRRIDLYLRYDQPLNSSELSLFKALIKRRIAREPVAYIMGRKEFWSMDIAVTKDALIPRPETECLVEAALSLLLENAESDMDFCPQQILELGTGSGAVILAIASRHPEHIFFASDRSVKTVELARRNAKRHDLDRTINFFAGDWLKPLKNNMHLFDMIISNPPYIKTEEIDKLQPEIHRYEPRVALNGGKDGLCCIRHIIDNAHLYLKRQGSLLIEIGHDQKGEVQKIIDNCGNYEQIAFTKDYAGHYRVVQMKQNRDRRL